MNVLLVMPRAGHFRSEWEVPAVGIAYISSFLKQNSIKVHTLNMYLQDGNEYDSLKNAIERHNIDILGTGELVSNLSKVQDIVKYARRIKPTIKIWVGGSLVTHSPYEAMKLLPEADFGMIGEGEITALELVHMLERTNNEYKKQDVDAINGLIYRDGEKLLCTAPREEIMDLDSLPFPDWDGFQLVDVCLKYSKQYNHIIAPVVSSRSCPMSCTFCSKSGGKKYRKRSLENIFAEIDMLTNKYRVNKLIFNDELFTNNISRLYKFCDMIEKYHLAYRVSMRIGANLSYDLLVRMRQSGCRGIYYGLESADDAVLKSMRKFTTIKEIERCLKITKQAGIIVEGCFIFGDPAETKESMRTTIDWIEKNYGLGIFDVSPIILFPGSQLYEDAVTCGKIKDTTQFIADGCPLINISGLTDEEYQDMIKKDLISLQKMKQVKRKDISLFIEDEKIKGKAMCSNCSAEMCFEISEMGASLVKRYPKHCEHCGGLEYLNLFPAYYELIKDKLAKVLAEKKVAVFGCGDIWKLFYNAEESVFLKYDYAIVDETLQLQKEGWNGREVHSPEIIKEKQLDTVLVMLSLPKLEIREKLEKDYGLLGLDIIMCYEII